MLEICERSPTTDSPHLTLTLPFEARQKSRQRVVLSSGEEAALLLPRGTIVRGGERLRLSDGRIVEVVAASELVSVARCTEPHGLMRGAYHLGNRHVAVQIEEGSLRYLHDHVLDAMVNSLGLTVRVELCAFEPEAGAYASAHLSEHGTHHTHGPA